MKFENIKPGQTLYDVHSYPMGNTTLRSVGIWEVEIISVNPGKRTALVAWNNNRAEVWRESTLSKLRANKPELIDGFFGSKRIKPRAPKAKAIP